MFHWVFPCKKLNYMKYMKKACFYNFLRIKKNKLLNKLILSGVDIAFCTFMSPYGENLIMSPDVSENDFCCLQHYHWCLHSFFYWNWPFFSPAWLRGRPNNICGDGPSKTLWDQDQRDRGEGQWRVEVSPDSIYYRCSLQYHCNRHRHIALTLHLFPLLVNILVLLVIIKTKVMRNWVDRVEN